MFKASAEAPDDQVQTTKYIAVVQTSPLHGIAGEADVVGRGGVLDQQFAGIEIAVQVVVGGRRDSGRDQREKQRSRER